MQYAEFFFWQSLKTIMLYLCLNGRILLKIVVFPLCTKCLIILYKSYLLLYIVQNCGIQLMFLENMKCDSLVHVCGIKTLCEVCGIFKVLIIYFLYALPNGSNNFLLAYFQSSTFKDLTHYCLFDSYT